ncbi:MAG: prepilin-type N-terminal cleavage/methylation domain-containing protein [Candidatus Omnitrophota bacterium]|nr:prepilin-type N-terminal cleavage/methylation domain-containing protein [Candidatus Omnitrophota bacterium]
MLKTKSFTLIEMVIVLVIVGILSTLGISRYFVSVERSRGAEAKAMLSVIYRGFQTGRAEDPAFNLTADLTPLSTNAAWNIIMMDNPNVATRAWFSYYVYDNVGVAPLRNAAYAYRRTGAFPYTAFTTTVNLNRFVRVDLLTSAITTSGQY